MAIFKFTWASSVFTTLAGDHAFDSDSSGADTLIVGSGATLSATGVGSKGAFLANTGAWTVTINGTIVSQQGKGIELAAGNTAVSTIAIGADGIVEGQSAIELNSSAIVDNAGVISGSIVIANAGTRTITNTGTITAIRDDGGLSNDTVTNSGTIRGQVSLTGGNNTVTNSGKIGGFTNDDFGWDFLRLGDGNDTVTNSGTIATHISLASGNNTLTNSGTIAGYILGGHGNDTIINTGAIAGSVYLRSTTTLIGGGGIGIYPADAYDLVDGTNALTNSGTIGGIVEGGGGQDTIINSGMIAGHVDLRNGANTLTNSGIIGGVVVGGAGKDTVENTGQILGVIDLKGGNDVFIGGDNVETFLDNAGADFVKLGGNNDTYVATTYQEEETYIDINGNVAPYEADGIDTIDGGTGIDTYDASASANFTMINLDNISHDLAPFFAGGTVAANTALLFTGGAVAANTPPLSAGGTVAASTPLLASAFNSQKDLISGFENVKGGSSVDLVYGSAADNVLDGLAGNDYLFGFGGNDTLNGGSGADRLFGGAGKDSLTGGTEADTFYFGALSDSGVTKATRDVITDFQDKLDLIHLANIDANTLKGTVDDAFSFIGTNVAFGNQAGQLRSLWDADGQIIEGDVNGDGLADFSIALIDPHHQIQLSNADFLL